MISSFSKHPLAQQIDAERNRQFMKEMLQHLAGGIFGAALVWFVFKSEASLAGQELWLKVNYVLVAISIVIYLIYFKRRDWFSVSEWGWIAVLFSLIFGVGWAMAPVIFLQTENPVYIVTLISILIGLCASPSISMSLYPLGYLGFITPVMASLTWNLKQLDFGQNLIITLLVPIFWLFLLGYSLNLHRVLIRTIRLRLEKDAAKNEAEKANISKSKFLAAASHDIRQPLQAISLFTSALENELQGEESKRLFQRLQDSVDSMSDLLGSLLDISRLDARTLDMNPRAIELQILLDKLHKIFSAQANSKGIQFAYQVAPCVVHTDPLLLERILSNLLSNALRYTQQGTITLRCRLSESSAFIDVEDSGQGIPEQEFEAVFAEFHQLANTERDRQKGLGLGLAIVQRLCDLLGHKVLLESQVGRGSKFTVILPLDSKDNLPVENKDPGASLGIGGLNVLVIDDDESIRYGLKSLLEQWSCKVMCYEGAAQALAMLAAADTDWQPQLIISDYRLRNLETGAEAIKGIYDAVGHSIPAILITGDTDPDRIREARDSGHTLLHKPVKPGQLRAAIQRLTRAMKK